MKSIRTKIIMAFATFAALFAGVLLIISIVSLKVLNERDSNQLLVHLGRESANSIDMMLSTTEHSVNNIYYYAYDQLEALYGKLYSENFRREYLDRIGQLALSEAKGNGKTDAVYFHLADDIKDEPYGFLFQKVEDGSFIALPPTDISRYEKDDFEHVGWYWLPKEAKEALWIGPYYGENLGFRMVSYVEPLYVYGRFAGVIGMDINIDLICDELQEITIYDSGSAMLFDMDENILYQKNHESGLEKKEFTESEAALLDAMHESLDTDAPVEYTAYEGEMKLYALRLVNGMTLCVAAPVDEINATQRTVLGYSIAASAVIFVIAMVVVLLMLNSFLRPLKELTAASGQLAEGNLDVRLEYQGDDEIGQLSKTFGIMAGSLKRYFDHFHSLAYTDSLTGLNNKAAFSMTKEVIESEIQMGRASFSVIVMDVNNLKLINDSIGHEMGDLLLQHVALCLRKAFVGFPLYRIGGDEFCSIINNNDPQELIDRLQSITADMSKKDFDTFHTSYQVAAGSAVYLKGTDQSFDEVFIRADQAMYENKRMLKERESK